MEQKLKMKWGYLKMSELGLGLQAFGRSIGTCAIAIAWIYVVGIGTKTFLIYTGKATAEELKNWFKFRDNSGRL